ncbi:hypothetical protein [Actinomarinicola tropica]|uniref:DUF5709 domain-containing protein n=1 Tax=Actinomarinicola tropica TaxID=2789776 RepID=A0A5Q2RIK6_9ACTN|nr:hypothetical protein [Actinomarinicola tropica]QGG93827.1 hypothetical protein GH723_01150 [Actinomarinicola tropica]
MSDPSSQDRAEQLDEDKLSPSDTPVQDLDYPPEEPLGVDAYGTTAAEERYDEPLEERVAREEPETIPEEEPGMRLVSPEQGAGPDEEADAVGGARPAADLSAEEAAVNETAPPPMGDGDGYVEGS